VPTSSPTVSAVGTFPSTADPAGLTDCGTGFSPGWWTAGQADTTTVRGLGMFCASASINFSANNQLTFSFAKTGTGTFKTFAGGTPFEDDCNPDEVLVGYDGRSGDFLDAVQAVCAPLQTVYK
jgi:hypothetical protein